MAEAKHTPGEWSVLEHEGDVFVLAGGAMQIAAVTYVIEHAGEQGSRRRQNARMMAAAPVLLEALTEYDEAFAEFNPESKSDRHRMRLAVIKARAAIAKATEVA